MASKALFSALMLLLATSASNSLTLDEEATNDVIAAASGPEINEIAIIIRGPYGENLVREELLHAKTTDDNSMSLYYNSKSKKVSLESLNGNHIKSVSWSLGAHSRGNLILIVSHSKVKMLVGCKSLHWHPMSGRHDVLTLLAGEKLKLYHKENAPVEVYDSEKSVVDALNCNQLDHKPPVLMTVDSDVEEVKDFIAREERMKLQEEMQGDDPRNNYIDPNVYAPLPLPTTPKTTTQRGDIPATDIESCDDEVIRQLKLLRQTIELLRRELADQKSTVDDLRNQLRACCNRVVQPPVERCSGSSCYPGY